MTKTSIFFKHYKINNQFLPEVIGKRANKNQSKNKKEISKSKSQPSRKKCSHIITVILFSLEIAVVQFDFQFILYEI